MAVIKSGNSPDQLEVDPVSNAAHVTIYNSDGEELGNNANPIRVNASVSFPAVQPISAASLPLPSDAATETTLLAVKTAVEALSGTGTVFARSFSISASGDSILVISPGPGLSIRLQTVSISHNEVQNGFIISLREGLLGSIRKSWVSTDPSYFNETSNWKLPPDTSLVINLSAAALIVGGVAVNIEYGLE